MLMREETNVKNPPFQMFFLNEVGKQTDNLQEIGQRVQGSDLKCVKTPKIQNKMNFKMSVYLIL